MSTVFSCPACGVALRVEAMGTGSGSGGWQSGRAFAMGAAPLGSEYSRETPLADMSSIEAGVKTPLAQAIITATVCGLLVILGCVFKSWPWVAIPTAWVITFALAWWVLLLNTRGLLKTVERVIGKDLDGDGQIGFTVEITDLTEGKKRMSFAHFPARQAEVERFATAAINGWLTVNSPHRLSRRKFTQLRDVSLDRGLLAWRCAEARQQGVELTAVGRHVFKRLVIGA